MVLDVDSAAVHTKRVRVSAADVELHFGCEWCMIYMRSLLIASRDWCICAHVVLCATGPARLEWVATCTHATAFIVSW